MSAKRITATEAGRNFSKIVNRVLYRGEEFVVERAGEPVCRIVPTRPLRLSGAEALRVLKSLPRVKGLGKAVRRVVAKQPLAERPPTWPD